jgi:hypothetical protein
MPNGTAVYRGDGGNPVESTSNWTFKFPLCNFNKASMSKHSLSGNRRPLKATVAAYTVTKSLIRRQQAPEVPGACE